MTRLNPDQHRVLAVRAGLCVVIAGPGTGKTETLAAKTEALMQAGERPLVVTYTRSAAHTMTQRIGRLRHHAVIGTCHSLAFRLVRRLSAFLPRQRRLLSAREKEGILHRVLQRCGLPMAELELEEVIVRLKVGNPTTDQERELLRVYEQEKGPFRMDFQDLLMDATLLLTGAADWLATYQASFTHVLIDEAQDLDPLQARFLALFVPPHDALTIFLDPDQAIYGYAGANPDYLLSLFAYIPATTTIELRTNYRSRPSLLRAAHRLIRHNGSTRTAVAVREGQAVPRFTRVHDEVTEACLVADAIHGLLHDGVPPADILCLVRRNVDRTLLEVELAVREIPFFLVQASREWHPTYLEWAVQPLTACLLLTVGRNGTDLWEAVLRPSVGSPLAQQLAGAADLLAAATVQSESVARRVHAVYRDLEDLHHRQHLPVVLLGEVAARRLGMHGRDLEGALRALARFSSLAAFAAHIDTLHALSRIPHDRRIRLSTVHRAKGREARVVFVLGLAEGLFPLANADVTEERRLCFVALTRSRDALFATSPRHIGGHAAAPSRFLAEAGLRRRFFPSAARIRSLITQALAPFPPPHGEGTRYQKEDCDELNHPAPYAPAP